MIDSQGYYILMNKAAEEITGFTFEETHDCTFHASCHSRRSNGDLYPIDECPVVGHQRAGTATKNEPEMFMHKNGSFYDIE